MVAPETLARIALLDELDTDARLELANCARRRRYAAGDRVFEEGAAADRLHVLAHGAVTIRQKTRYDGPEISVVTVREPGEAFGVAGMLSGHARRSAAQCLEACEIIEIDRTDLFRVLEGSPANGLRVLRQFGALLAERLGNTREQLRSRLRPGLISHG